MVSWTSVILLVCVYYSLHGIFLLIPNGHAIVRPGDDLRAYTVGRHGGPAEEGGVGRRLGGWVVAGLPRTTSGGLSSFLLSTWEPIQVAPRLSHSSAIKGSV